MLSDAQRQEVSCARGWSVSERSTIERAADVVVAAESTRAARDGILTLLAAPSWCGERALEAVGDAEVARELSLGRASVHHATLRSEGRTGRHRLSPAPNPPRGAIAFAESARDRLPPG